MLVSIWFYFHLKRGYWKNILLVFVCFLVYFCTKSLSQFLSVGWMQQEGCSIYINYNTIIYKLAASSCLRRIKKSSLIHLYRITWAWMTLSLQMTLINLQPFVKFLQSVQKSLSSLKKCTKSEKFSETILQRNFL